jgi:predicted DNA-binding protein YlxM (UPF0122 family)
VLKTRYYENVSLAEIASTRGVSSEAARQTVKEALKKIRRDPESAAQLEEYRQEIMSVSMKKVGFRSFRETGYSSVEWAAELLVRRRMQLATGLAKLKF